MQTEPVDTTVERLTILPFRDAWREAIPDVTFWCLVNIRTPNGGDACVSNGQPDSFQDALQGAIGPSLRLERELGGGGMSRVFVAHEVALGRDVVVKVLPPGLAGELSLERFRREIRLAAGLQHPHIVPVLSAGGDGELLYYTTPFVSGENLRQRMGRAAQLPLDEALQLTIEVAEALAYAHGQGLVHRDVKPDNVLLSGGHALLTDFGIAKAIAPVAGETLTVAGVSLGTPLYMAPEQAAADTELDARGDVYALGCVLYELLAGQPPFSGNAQAMMAQHAVAPFPRVRHIRPDIPDAVDAVIHKATAKSPADRYQSASDFGAALRGLTQPVAATHRQHRSRAGIAAVVLGVVALGAVMAWRALSHSAALSQRDTVLLADFVNRTGDTVFDGTLKQALAVQLRQTPFLNLFPDEGVSETLALMERAPGERITPAIGREICQRQALKAMIVGTISTLGRNYVVTIEAVGPTGDVIASQQAEADGKEHVLAAVQTLATALRRQLGESRNTIRQYNAPIEQATTSSLQALSAYSKGLETIYRGESRAALPLFVRATELDSNFASAYNWTAWTYANLGDQEQSARFAARAFALRDRVTELERLHIDDNYYIWATADWGRQYDNDQQLVRLYPNDWLAHNDLAMSYDRLGDDEKSVAEAREASRLNPNEVHPYLHGATALLKLGRFGEARAMIAAARARKLDHPWFHNTLLQASFVEHDTASVRQELDAIRVGNGAAPALLWEARIAAFNGRWAAADSLYQRSATMRNGPGTRPRAPAPVLEAELRRPLFQPCRPDAVEAAGALDTSRASLPRALLTLPVTVTGTLCGDSVKARRLTQLALHRFPQSFAATLFAVPLANAMIALQAGDAAKAVAALEPVAPYDAGGQFFPVYIRGQAYLRAQRAAEARNEFQRIIDHPGWDALSPMYPLAYLGLARAAALAGDATASRAAYERFFAVWRGADPVIPVLREARSEYERFSRTTQAKSRN